MNAVAEKQASGLDKLLILIAVALLIAGVYGFYYFTETSSLNATASVFGGAILGALVFFRSQPGKDLWAFGRLSWREMKKVVWPTQPEAMQTTIAVIVLCLLMGGFFWLCDIVLSRISGILY